MFVSDPQRLDLDEPTPRLQVIEKRLRHCGITALIVHASYLIADATRGFQKALIKRELFMAQQLKTRGFNVKAYAVHLNGPSVKEACEKLDPRLKQLIAYENTSHKVNPKQYIPMLYG